VKPRPFPQALVTIALLSTSPAPQAADASLGTQICSVLTVVQREVQMFDPQAARARMVSAIEMKFGNDPDKLREVRTEIDRVTTASCRKEREGLLRITQLLSLSEAFDERW
jgi:hypothetical protein